MPTFAAEEPKSLEWFREVTAELSEKSTPDEVREKLGEDFRVNSMPFGWTPHSIGFVAWSYVSIDEKTRYQTGRIIWKTGEDDHIPREFVRIEIRDSDTTKFEGRILVRQRVRLVGIDHSSDNLLIGRIELTYIDKEGDEVEAQIPLQLTANGSERTQDRFQFVYDLEAGDEIEMEVFGGPTLEGLFFGSGSQRFRIKSAKVIKADADQRKSN